MVMTNSPPGATESAEKDLVALALPPSWSAKAIQRPTEDINPAAIGIRIIEKAFLYCTVLFLYKA